MKNSDKIYDYSIEAQCCLEKVEDILNLMLACDDIPSVCQTCAYFVNGLIQKTNNILEEIELISNK